MRIAIRWVVLPGKISTALLLVAGFIALAIPGNDVALGQSSTGTVAQAPLFTAIDLNPSGFCSSTAGGVSGGQQVGTSNPWGDCKPGGPNEPIHALLWRGSATSVVDLHPRGFTYSWARKVCGGQQVGDGGGPQTRGQDHALLFRGSADSVIDLHPSRFEASSVWGTSGGQQVGSGVPQGSPRGYDMVPTTHALLWRGTAASVVDLNPRGFGSSEVLDTDGEAQVGSGQPEGIFVPGSGVPATHALLWHGTAASVVDLNPTGFEESQAWGTFAVHQVGWGILTPRGHGTHALMWRGTAASVVDLHPPGFSQSWAYGTNGEEQVGEGNLEGDYYGSIHALLWRGNAASVVDLHAFLPHGFLFSGARGIDLNGDIVGYAYGSIGSIGDPTSSHAFLWRRNVQRPPSTSREQRTARCQ